MPGKAFQTVWIYNTEEIIIIINYSIFVLSK